MDELFNVLASDDYYLPVELGGISLNPIRQMFLLATLDKYSKTRKTVNVLEVGSWMGSSALIIIKGIKNFYEHGNLVCCDQWKPYKENVRDKVLESGVAKKIFDYNIDKSEFDVTIFQGDSRKVLPLLKDESFDIIFIDGNHRYEVVKEDIKNAKRLVVPGGVICGDDLELGWPVCGEVDLSKECIQRDNISFHPGVSKAVYDVFGIDRSYAGFWAVQKNKEWEQYYLKGEKIYIPPFIPSVEWVDKLNEYIKREK